VDLTRLERGEETPTMNNILYKGALCSETGFCLSREQKDTPGGGRRGVGSVDELEKILYEDLFSDCTSTERKLCGLERRLIKY
jgi:hypothetical protein